MDFLLEPFGVSFVQRALIGGSMVAAVCAMVGTWVILRGMAFLGDAMSHGMLPGIAIAYLLGGNPLIGAGFSAAAMAFGVSAIARRRRLSQDTTIGLLFVGMLAAGVIIISRSQSFAVDLTGILFGDILAVTRADLLVLAVLLVIVALIARTFHRPFMALAFDERKAFTLGLRPRLAGPALLLLVAISMAGSFRVVGTLLVFGLLIAPPAAALPWVKSVPGIMALAALVGVFSVSCGLVVSWYAQTAAGATVAAISVLLFFVSIGADSIHRLLLSRRNQSPRGNIGSLHPDAIHPDTTKGTTLP